MENIKDKCTCTCECCKDKSCCEGKCECISCECCKDESCCETSKCC